MKPARKAATFAAAISGLRANFCSRKRTVPSVGRWYIQDSSPSANMFFARSASFFEMSKSASDRTVVEVSGTACTWYAESEPSSSGFVA